MRVDSVDSTNFYGARARKLIEKVNNTRKLSDLKISFEELKGMYNEIGYDVFFKRGSHAVIHLDNGVNIPLVIPHKTKNVHSLDLKRFRYVLAGEFDNAIDCT